MEVIVSFLVIVCFLFYCSLRSGVCANMRGAQLQRTPRSR